MKRIEKYLYDLGFKKFKLTYMVVDAIIRNFDITGEAAKIIPIESRKKGLPLYIEYVDKFSEF